MHALRLRAAGVCCTRRQLIGVVSGLHAVPLSASSSHALFAFRHSTIKGDSKGDSDNKTGPNVRASGATDASAPPKESAEATASARATEDAAASSPASPAGESPTATSTAASAPSDGVSTALGSSSSSSNSKGGDMTAPEPEPVRWVQPAYQDPDTLPIVDDKGEYIVSRVQWPTGEIAYRTPAPVDDKLAPRFGYNVVQVRKHVSWWKYNQRYPRLSLAYINIQVVFLLGLAWLVAFLTTEYRNTTEAMRTPGAMVGEHRGKGPATNQTQKVTFEKNEMTALMDKAQNNWYDGKAEASYVGSKEYKMKKIPRPKEFSADDFRKR